MREQRAMVDVAGGVEPVVARHAHGVVDVEPVAVWSARSSRGRGPWCAGRGRWRRAPARRRPCRRRRGRARRCSRCGAPSTTSTPVRIVTPGLREGVGAPPRPRTAPARRAGVAPRTIMVTLRAEAGVRGRHLAADDAAARGSRGSRAPRSRSSRRGWSTARSRRGRGCRASARSLPVLTVTACRARSSTSAVGGDSTVTARSPVKRACPRTRSMFADASQSACDVSSQSWTSARCGARMPPRGPPRRSPPARPRRPRARLAAPLPARSSAFDGMHAQYEHSPPTSSASIEDDLQAAFRRVVRDVLADDAGTDHDQVVFTRCHATRLRRTDGESATHELRRRALCEGLEADGGVLRRSQSDELGLEQRPRRQRRPRGRRPARSRASPAPRAVPVRRWSGRERAPVRTARRAERPPGQGRCAAPPRRRTDRRSTSSASRRPSRRALRSVS